MNNVLPDISCIAGVDEVGRGSWAGPVMAAAVMLPHEAFFLERFGGVIRDSKQLSSSQREDAYAWLTESPQIIWSVGSANVQEIDTLNIRVATHLAMKRACTGLSRAPEHVLVDGRDVLTLEGISCSAMVHGDRLHPSIAAASIVAKVTRDRLMDALSYEYPQFGWDRNKGYGTAVHANTLRLLGPSAHHRMSYRPVFLAKQY